MKSASRSGMEQVTWRKIDIAVDGVHPETDVKKKIINPNGANVLVAGTAIFSRERLPKGSANCAALDTRCFPMAAADGSASRSFRPSLRHLRTPHHFFDGRFVLATRRQPSCRNVP